MWLNTRPIHSVSFNLAQDGFMLVPNNPIGRVRVNLSVVSKRIGMNVLLTKNSAPRFATRAPDLGQKRKTTFSMVCWPQCFGTLKFVALTIHFVKGPHFPPDASVDAYQDPRDINDSPQCWALDDRIASFE
jgi:hypothetical protein